MSKHTPGPWQYRMVDNYSRIYMPGITGPMLYGYTGEEDARLIAAAPELLAALEGILVWDDGNLPGDMIEAARAAIVKATRNTT